MTIFLAYLTSCTFFVCGYELEAYRTLAQCEMRVLEHGRRTLPMATKGGFCQFRSRVTEDDLRTYGGFR